MSLEPQIMDAERTEATKPAMSAEKLESMRAAKREAAARFTKRKAEEKAERLEKSAKLIEQLKKEKMWDRIGPELQDFLTKMSTASANSGAASNSTFSKLFGNAPKVGDKVTLIQCFERTRKGQSEIDRLVRTKWAGNGIEIKYTPDEKDIFKSVYEIVKLPQ